MKVLLLCPFDPTIFPELDFKGTPPVVLCPWIKNTIELLRSSGQVKLTVISEYKNLKKDTFLVYEDVNYHFITQRVPFLNRSLPYRVRLKSGFAQLRKKVRTIISAVDPDLINLFGTEHDLSYCMAYISGVPKLITIQGLIHEVFKQNMNNIYYEKKLEIEKRIFKQERYFSVQDLNMKGLIQHYNPDAQIFQWQFPGDSFKVHPRTSEGGNAFRLIFFARIEKDKGIEDLIEALGIIVKEKSNVQLKIIGTCDTSYQSYLIKKIASLNLSSVINFIGYIASRDDLFKEIQESDVTVLPTYYDNSPKTILESIALGTPVITYEAGEIPGINDRSEILSVVKHADVRGIANSVIDLMKSPDKLNQMRENGLIWYQQNYNSNKIRNQLINIYKEIKSKQ